jgi:arylsulfatase A-like enzyme
MLTAPIQHVDVMPTILDFLNVPIPRQAQGRSIMPLIEGAESGADRFAVMTLGDDSLTAIVGGDGWKLIVNRISGTHELYYLPTDPDERNDLATRFPDAAIALSRRLEAWALANQSTLTAAADDGPRG